MPGHPVSVQPGEDGQAGDDQERQLKRHFMAGEVAQVSAILTQLQPEAQLSAWRTLWASTIRTPPRLWHRSRPLTVHEP